MNSLLLAVLMSCAPVATYPDAPYPDAGPANSGSSSHHRLFRWLRGHHHNNKCPSAGNGHAGGSWSPVAPAVEAGTVEAVTLESAPTVVPPPACHCHAGSSWSPVAAAPAPTVIPPVSPPATAGAAPRLVPVPQPQRVTTSAEPPIAE
jgi:hypothetical protein